LKNILQLYLLYILPLPEQICFFHKNYNSIHKQTGEEFKMAWPLLYMLWKLQIAINTIQIVKKETMNQKNKIITTLSFLSFFLLYTAHAYSATVQRSNFIVSNLSCTSCLATIEAELKGMEGVLGMDADLRAGRVTVDHLSSLNYERIGASITNLGYPAQIDWTATVPAQYTNRFAGESRYRSGCSSGGCGVSGGADGGLTTWKAVPASGTITRTTLQVSRLSCTSCLSNIARELSSIEETYGMKGYINRGVVIVDHVNTFDNSKIAAAISSLGYPARVVAANEIPAQKAFTASPNSGSARPGGGCSGRGPCNATAASWQKLYQRYFTQTNAK
jgi:copper chaperone CopZ